MVEHLLDGLEADLPSLSRQEALHELLSILLLVSEGLRHPRPASGPPWRGASPMT